MKLKLYIILLLTAIGSLYSMAFANRIEVKASFDSMAIFIGQQTTLTIEAIQPRSEELQFPIFSDVIDGKIELVETIAPDTVILENEIIKVSNRYKATAFDSTLAYIPYFQVINGTDTILTNSVTLKVLDMPVDSTQQAIADIKDIYKPPFDWMRLLTIIAICILSAAIIAAIVFLVIKLRKKKTDNAEPQEIIDPRTAYEIAMTNLQNLEQKELWQAGMNKEYHTELTDIVKQYVSSRFEINAVEQSTDDLLTYFKTDRTLRDMKSEITLLGSILQLADLVKFAKFTPIASDNERSLKDAYRFVEQTKAEEKPDTNEAKTQEEQS